LELSAGQTVRQTFSLEALKLSPVIEPATPPPRPAPVPRPPPEREHEDGPTTGASRGSTTGRSLREWPQASRVLPDVIDQLVAGLPWGNAVFSDAKTIPYREVRRIELLVSRSRSVDELTAELESRAKVPTGTAPVQVSDLMEATLTGSPGLTIQAEGN